MSVRRVACGVRVLFFVFCFVLFCLEHFSGTVCPTSMIFGIWVGLGPTLCMLNFGRGTCWSPGTAGVKNVKQCSMTTKLGQKNRRCKLKTMVTSMEVEGHQRSNGVNYVLWLPHLVKRTADAS